MVPQATALPKNCQLGNFFVHYFVVLTENQLKSSFIATPRHPFSLKRQKTVKNILIDTRAIRIEIS